MLRLFNCVIYPIYKSSSNQSIVVKKTILILSFNILECLKKYFKIFRKMPIKISIIKLFNTIIYLNCYFIVFNMSYLIMRDAIKYEKCIA